jgi:N4-gp56 family major capsid protein
MSIQSWDVDRPSTGAYPEHEMSAVFRASSFLSPLFQEAEMKMVKSGETISIPIVDNLSLPSSVNVNELDRLPVLKLSITAKTISLAEKGLSVQVTRKSVNRSPIDILQEHKEMLQRTMSRTLEATVAEALDDMLVKYVATGPVSQNVATNGTAAAAALNNLNFYHARYINNYLRDQLRVPKRSKGRAAGKYLGIFRGNAELALRNDPEFVEFNTGVPSSMEKDLVGEIAGIKIVLTDDSNVLANNVGTNSDVSEGFIIGDEAVYMCIMEGLSLKYDFSESYANDYGRFKYIAWHGDIAAGLPADSANAGLVRGLHFTST